MRKTFLVAAIVGTIALTGCSSAVQAQDSTGSLTHDEQREESQDSEVETGNYEGMAYPIPGGWEESRHDGSVLLRNDDGMIQINEPVEYDPDVTDRRSIASVVSQALVDSGGYTVGTLEESTVNGSQRYTADFSYDDDDMSFDGRLVVVFSDSQYWMVMSGVWGDSGDEFDAVLNSLVVS